MKMFYDVADEMLQHIPAEEEGLIADLKKARETSLYQPPDTQGIAWQKAAWGFAHRFGDKPPETDWQKKLVEIWDREAQAAQDAHDRKQAEKIEHSLPSLKEVLRHDETRSLPAIVANLLEAAKILYHRHSFDGNGHEVLEQHIKDGTRWLEWMHERRLWEPHPTFNAF